MTTFDFANVPCPILDCGAALSLRYFADRWLWRGDLDEAAPIGLEQANTSAWQIECPEGHVVLLPGPIGCPCEDQLGPGCPHEDSEDYDWSEENRTFRSHDHVRLAALLAQFPAPATPAPLSV